MLARDFHPDSPAVRDDFQLAERILNFAESLPKTRSGKIMRRLLRNVAAGQELTGDISTLEDRTVVEKLQEGAEE